MRQTNSGLLAGGLTPWQASRGLPPSNGLENKHSKFYKPNSFIDQRGTLLTGKRKYIGLRFVL